MIRMSATMWRPPASHQVGQYHEEQKVFRQVVDEIQTVIELEIEHFIFGFRIYMKYMIKCEQKQGVCNGHCN